MFLAPYFLLLLVKLKQIKFWRDQMRIETLIELPEEDYGKYHCMTLEHCGDYFNEEEFLDYCLRLAKIMGFEDFEWILATKYNGKTIGLPFTDEYPL